MSKNKITFVFDDESDAKELMASLNKYTEITWNNETKDTATQFVFHKMADGTLFTADDIFTDFLSLTSCGLLCGK